jgi:hypothetical protein
MTRMLPPAVVVRYKPLTSGLVFACGCMRYPSSPCPVQTETLLCPQCVTARCVLVRFPDYPESKEHISVDNLTEDVPPP